jgi:hypothetical protein
MNEAEDHGTSASAYWAVELPAAADRALAMLAPRPLSGAFASVAESEDSTRRRQPEAAFSIFHIKRDTTVSGVSVRSN